MSEVRPKRGDLAPGTVPVGATPGAGVRAITRRHWAKLVALALLITFALAAQAQVSQARTDAERLGRGDASQRTLSVTAPTKREGGPLTRERREELAALPGVRAVTPYDGDTAEAYMADDALRTYPQPLALLPWTAAHPPLAARQGDSDADAAADLDADAAPGKNQIVVPDGFAGRTPAQLLGREIIVVHTPLERIDSREDGQEVLHGGEPTELRLTVVAVHDGSHAHVDGPGSSYVQPRLAAELYAASKALNLDEVEQDKGFEQAQIEVESAGQVSAVRAELRDKGIESATVTEALRAPTTEMSALGTTGVVASGVAVAVSALFGLALGTQRARARLAEVRRLKAAGVGEGRIVLVLARELFLVGALTATLGVLLGLATVTVLFGLAAFPLATALLLLSTPVLAWVVGALLPLHYVRRAPADRAAVEVRGGMTAQA